MLANFIRKSPLKIPRLMRSASLDMGDCPAQCRSPCCSECLFDLGEESNQEPRNPGKGIAEIEGKATRVGASERGIKSISRRSVPCHILLVVSSVVSQDPEILGGEPVFTGARVPVKSLFDHLQTGDSIEQFLEGFPSVRREQVIALLEEAREHALSAS